MPEITRDEVAHLAMLARIDLDDAELDHLAPQLSVILESVASISAVAGDDQAYDGPFYRSRSPLSVVDKVKVPTFVTGGEYDLFQRGEPLLYQRLRADGVPSRLLIGPWTHLQASSGPGLPADGGTIDSLNHLTLNRFKNT